MDMASAEGGLPELWSSERPALYHLVVALVRSNDGAVINAESCQVNCSPTTLPVRRCDMFIRVRGAEL